MIDKIITADQAVAGVEDGMTIMIGGFLGTGTPECIIDALVKKGVKDLTVIANDGGLPEGAYGAKTARGVGKLLEKGMIKHIIASHVGMNPLIGDGMIAGTLKCTLVPQGTLAEKIRAGNYNLGGVLTPTGVSTPMEKDENGNPAKDEMGRDKITIELDGKKFLLERPLRADFAFCRATVADKFGNFYSAKATKNFNYVMAGAAETTIIATEKLVEIDSVDPDIWDVPGVVVNGIVEGEPVWQI